MTPNDKRMIASMFVDGALDPDEVDWFEAQMKEDAALAQFVGEIRQLKHFVRTQPPPRPQATPEVCWQRFQAAKRRSLPPVPWWRRLGDWLPVHPAAIAAPAALLVVFAFLLNTPEWHGNRSQLAALEKREADRIAREARMAAVRYPRAPSPVRAADPQLAAPRILELQSSQALHAKAFEADGASVIWISGVSYRPQHKRVQ